MRRKTFIFLTVFYKHEFCNTLFLIDKCLVLVAEGIDESLI